MKTGAPRLLDARDPQAIAGAAARLAAGELVAWPTETVYGLGARADDDAAVAQIYALKGRPPDHPLIVHVADTAAAARFTPALPPLAQRLIDAFWPGPLTVIVPRAPGIATAAAGGHATVGLRSPSHPVARALLQAAAERGVAGVAAPSANRFGRISPTTAAHVVSEFGDALTVLDGGACPVGIESAIVDCTRGRAVLLRPGVLTRAALQAALGEPLADADAGAPRASGTLAVHYAPRARVRLMEREALWAALGAARLQPGNGPAVYSRTPLPAGVAAAAAVVRPMPDDPRDAARQLFADLRALDQLGVAQVWVEQPPAGPEWDGVRDRLQRAAAA